MNLYLEVLISRLVTPRDLWILGTTIVADVHSEDDTSYKTFITEYLYVFTYKPTYRYVLVVFSI